MTWECPTYLSRKADDADGIKPLPAAQRLAERFIRNVLKVRCPSCRQFVLPLRLVDLTAMAAADRAALGAGLFACDGCWNLWETQQKPLADGTPFREDVMYSRIGAPALMVDKTAAILDLRDLERAERRRPESFDRAAFLAAHADKVARAEALIAEDRAARE